MTKRNVTKAHRTYVRNQLKAAGASWWGLIKMESRFLPHMLRPNEKIRGVVYGIRRGGPGRPSGMLVATDRRVIYIDRKPGYTVCDEVTYDMVAGVALNLQGPYASVTLHTRVSEYHISFAGRRPAEQFVKYIEKRTVERGENTYNNTSVVKQKDSNGKAQKFAKPTAEILTDTASKFLKTHDFATFSSVNREGYVNGAVVHYLATPDNHIYILTKSDTHKARNILANPNVAVTIADKEEMKTLQIEGLAEVELDNNIKKSVFEQLISPRSYGGKLHFPPVTELTEGSFVILRITPTTAKYSDYSHGR